MTVETVIVGVDGNLLGIGGGARRFGKLFGFTRSVVRSGWMHWLIKGMIDDVELLLFISDDCFRWFGLTTISRDDLERFKSSSSNFRWLMSGGEIEQVRFKLVSILLERRRLEWNEDERVKLCFVFLPRSNESSKIKKNKFLNCLRWRRSIVNFQTSFRTQKKSKGKSYRENETSMSWTKNYRNRSSTSTLMKINRKRFD